MSAAPTLIPARHKNVNRAQVCDENFVEFVRGWNGRPAHKPHPDEPVLPGSALSAQDFLELFESQLVSRHLDLMARVLRVQKKVFYTIGSSGHEGNAMVARLTRHTDPAFLHYRSRRLHGRALPQAARHGPDHGFGTELRSQPATTRSPAAATRSGAASPCGCCRRPRPSPRTCPRRWARRWRSSRRGASATHCRSRPIRIAICSFGDASSNHATAQTAFNTAALDRATSSLPAPVLFVCEDNGIGISVKTPDGWIASNFRERQGLDYFYADGLDLADGYGQVQAAVEHCRRTRRPTFLHLRTTRVMGHAGTDFEIEWRSFEELMAVEASDPLLRSAAIALESGLMTPTTCWRSTRPRA